MARKIEGMRGGTGRRGPEKYDETAEGVARLTYGSEQTLSLDLAPYGIRRKDADVLLGSFARAQQTAALGNMVLPAYGTLIGDVRRGHRQFWGRFRVTGRLGETQ
jgi:hypothetical protein